MTHSKGSYRSSRLCCCWWTAHGTGILQLLARSFFLSLPRVSRRTCIPQNLLSAHESNPDSLDPYL